MAEWTLGSEVDKPGLYWLIVKHKETGKKILICKDYRPKGNAVTYGDLDLRAFYDVIASKRIEPSIEILKEATLFIGESLFCSIDGKEVKCELKKTGEE